MTTNAIVLVVVVAMAALVLAATVAAVTFKTRTLGRDVKGYAARDRAEASERDAQQQRTADDPAAADAQADVDVGSNWG